MLNKAVYTTAPVAGGWAGAVIYLGRGSYDLGRGMLKYKLSNP